MQFLLTFLFIVNAINLTKKIYNLKFPIRLIFFCIQSSFLNFAKTVTHFHQITLLSPWQNQSSPRFYLKSCITSRESRV